MIKNRNKYIKKKLFFFCIYKKSSIFAMNLKQKRMKIYSVKFANGEVEDFYNLKSAKAAMKQDSNAKGVIYKIFSNGDFECCGNIKLEGNNKTFVANTRQQKESYN